MSEDLREKELRQSRDAAKEESAIQDEQKPLKLMKFITYTFVGLLVFALAFSSKTSLLLLITISNTASQTIDTHPYALLFIGCLLIAPSVLTLFKSIWKTTFKDSKTPPKQTLIWVITVESLVALGLSMLTLIAMPKFDILTNVMLLHGVGTLSAMVQLVANVITHGERRCMVTSMTSVVLIIAGYIFFALNYLREFNGRQEMALFVGLATGGTFLVSLNWWENYAMLIKISCFQNFIQDIKRSRNLFRILSSVVRIAVISTVLGTYVKLSGQDWSSVLSVTPSTKTVVVSLFAIQVISSALCVLMVKVACKWHAIRLSFVFPMVMVSPAALAAFTLAIWFSFRHSDLSLPHNTTFTNYCSNFSSIAGPGLDIMQSLVTDLTREVCDHIASLEGRMVGYVFLVLSLFSWWTGLVLCTLHIWSLSTHRIERTEELFVCNQYEAACIDQSMLLNTRFKVVHQPKHSSEKEKISIYPCATMWHETKEEMKKMMFSMFRLDKFRPKNQFNDVEFEFHIYFDDAFKLKNSKWCVNEYAETLTECIKEAYIIFSDESEDSSRQKRPLPGPKIFQTPYGCRLQCILPHGNLLIVHFKDKQRIRLKKRWSQVMYLYYLLDWKLNKPYFQMSKKNGGELSRVGEHLKKAKENTYILALDGDTDFQPSAIMLLVDRLRMYPEVGAACGRIHPTGTGPIVWYQKFEYAVVHWFQKTAEQVFGSVICCPGCFSLFRAAALVDGNVMKRFSSKPTQAAHYLQYDQGEDLWLSTLLLQQGWRFEYTAASDSCTSAPQGFKELYNQRRRWGTSIMTSCVNLLTRGRAIFQNKYITKSYVLYQIITMATATLCPANVCLMIAGCFIFVLGVDANTSLLMAVIPPTIYSVICYYLGPTKSDTQITVALAISAVYGLLIASTVLAVIGDMVIRKTFLTPGGLLVTGITVIYVFTALLHPHEFHLIIYGFLYLLCIPSSYLLLVIYSMFNMDNMSWGMRDSDSQGSAAPTDIQQKNAMCQDHGSVCDLKLDIQVNEDITLMNAAHLNTTKVSFQSEERTSPVTGDWSVEQLTHSSAELEEDEEMFWKDLIENHMQPIKNDKAREEQIKIAIKNLRNKIIFVMFFCNALWLVAAFLLQNIGCSVTISIPKVFINETVDPNRKIFIGPFGLMFLIGFGSHLVIQFFAMVWHRVQTLIHFIGGHH